MRRALALLLLLAGCAHQPPPSREKAGCEDLSGLYRLDPRSCGAFAPPFDMELAVWPDLSLLPRETAIVGIRQEGCDSVGFTLRGESGNDAFSRGMFTAAAHADGRGVGGEVLEEGETTNLEYAWRLERHGAGLRYTLRRTERKRVLSMWVVTSTRASGCSLEPM